MEIKLSSTNIAGCNGLRQDGDSISGLIRFDGEHVLENYVVLEFPNLNSVNVAIERLQELRQQWDEKINDPVAYAARLAHLATLPGYRP